MGSGNKSLSPDPCGQPLFAENWVRIGKILPPWDRLYFTGGSPPCALSRHPADRGTGHCNVLWERDGRGAGGGDRAGGVVGVAVRWRGKEFEEGC